MNQLYKSNNMQIILKIYDGLSSSNMNPLLKNLDDNIQWIETTGFPYGGNYNGIESVKLIFSRLESEWDNYKSTAQNYYETTDEQIIIVEGFYSGVYKKTKNPFQANFVHIWKFEDGKIIEFKQCLDSYLVRKVMNP